MSLHVTAGASRPATHSPENDTPEWPIVWHRTQIHTRPQHGCPLCVPVPCACGFDGDCCPQYFEHREAGAETSWRELAA